MATSNLAIPQTRSLYPGMARNGGDITGVVITALLQKSRGPFIGIACGTKTVLIRRELFKKSLAGLRVIKAELVTSPESDAGMIQSSQPTWAKGAISPNEPTWSLTGEPQTYRATHAIKVYAAGDHVKATRLFLHQNPRDYANMRILQEWKQAELKRRIPATGIKLNKYQKQIGVLERKLQALGELKRPENPAVSKMVFWQDLHTRRRVETNGVFGETREPESAETRRREHLWHLQRPVRRAVMVLARRTGWLHPHRTQVKAELTSAQLYKELTKLKVPYYSDLLFHKKIDAINDGTYEHIRHQVDYVLAERELRVTKWSDVKNCERERRKLGSFGDYLQTLWQFCNLEEKPCRSKYDEEPEYLANKWGSKRYYEWQAERDERAQLAEQIAAIKLLERDNEAGAK